MRILIPALVLVAAATLTARAYKEGPFPNMAGGFGDKNCRTCHFDNPLNAAGGQLTVAGIPATYAAGQEYPITITIARNDLHRGGFEIVARFVNGKLKGKQAGEWRLPDKRLQLIRSTIDPTLLFVQHNLLGSRASSPGANTWTVEWIAPVPAGPVQFNIAGNASNEDDSALGDFIYVKSARSVPAH